MSPAEPYGGQSNGSLRKNRPNPSYLDASPERNGSLNPVRGNRVIPVTGIDRGLDGVTGSKLGSKSEQKGALISGQRLRGSNSATEL